MKERNGFVSNSSSSSFIIIAPKKVICDALRQIDNAECKRWVDDTLLDAHPAMFEGKEVHFGTFTTEEAPEDIYSTVGDFMEYIKKHGGFTGERDYGSFTKWDGGG